MLNESRIDAVVKEIFDTIEFAGEPVGLYDPLRYMIEIGGKRVRPKLCLTVYSLFKDILEPSVLDSAAALEVFHTFTLIHDDIMDKSALRRGKETVWKKWSEDTAILSGDVMLIDSYNRISRSPSACHAKVLELFSKTAAQVCEGQQLDMDFESLEMIPMADYEKMIGLKTAVLLACSAKIGALIGGASDAECDAIYEYGYQLGMAFQVSDDYLDAYGDEKVFGKPIGGDIVNNKKCWLTTRAQQKVSPECRDELSKALAMPCDSAEQRALKIAAVKKIYGELGVDSDAKAEIQRFSQKAMSAVKDLSLGSVKTEVLRRFAERLVGRAK